MESEAGLGFRDPGPRSTKNDPKVIRGKVRTVARCARIYHSGNKVYFFN